MIPPVGRCSHYIPQFPPHSDLEANFQKVSGNMFLLETGGSSILADIKQQKVLEEEEDKKIGRQRQNKIDYLGLVSLQN